MLLWPWEQHGGGQAPVLLHPALRALLMGILECTPWWENATVCAAAWEEEGEPGSPAWQDGSWGSWPVLSCGKGLALRWRLYVEEVINRDHEMLSL
jgi:hypothetical protein